MKTAVISITGGVLVFAVCLGLSIATSIDWKHEMADTETSEFFFKLTIWPFIVVPSSLIPKGLWLDTIWTLSPILNSLVIFSFLFTIKQIRGRTNKHGHN